MHRFIVLCVQTTHVIICDLIYSVTLIFYSILSTFESFSFSAIRFHVAGFAPHQARLSNSMVIAHVLYNMLVLWSTLMHHTFVWHSSLLNPQVFGFSFCMVAHLSSCPIGLTCRKHIALHLRHIEAIKRRKRFFYKFTKKADSTKRIVCMCTYSCCKQCKFA